MNFKLCLLGLLSISVLAVLEPEPNGLNGDSLIEDDDADEEDLMKLGDADEEEDRMKLEKAVTQDFQGSDKDHSGFLEPEEMSDLMKVVGAPENFKWQVYDADKNGAISLNELMKLATSHASEVAEEGEEGGGDEEGDEEGEDAVSLLEGDEGEWEHVDGDEDSVLQEDEEGDEGDEDSLLQEDEEEDDELGEEDENDENNDEEEAGESLIQEEDDEVGERECALNSLRQIGYFDTG